ncbi:MAG: rhodanese-like domain-containing protein [Deltaproteobacteria bacterium]|nr:rhodanese-like domain-containing protein [Deltaproteobacteria bacterium]
MSGLATLSPMKSMAVKARISIFQQVIIILLFSLGMGLVVNTLRLNPLPLIGDWSHGSLRLRGETDIPIISLEDATVKFLSGEALFLDARSRADYQSGHIKGALNLPVHKGGFGEMLQAFSLKINRGRELIVYCDGIGCSLSPELASVLEGLGYRDLKILINGWTEWTMAGMPFEVE